VSGRGVKGEGASLLWPCGQTLDPRDLANNGGRSIGNDGGEKTEDDPVGNDDGEKKDRDGSVLLL